MFRIITSILASCGIVFVGVLVVHVTATAQSVSRPPLSDDHKLYIASKCTSVKSSLRQLHRSDASMRVNRGQLYEFVGTKLMARLNSRLAASRLDGGKLIGLTARYDKALIDFRESYRFYEETLSDLLRADCAKRPEAFFYDIEDASKKRTEVRKRITAMNQIMNDYYEEFGGFRDRHDSELGSS